MKQILEHTFIDYKCPKCKKSFTVDQVSTFCPLCGNKITPSHPKGKRGNGQGSVYKVKTGNWRISVTAGIDEKGNAIKRTKQGFRTKTEALAYLPKFQAEVQGLVKLDTLEDIYRAWVSTHSASAKTMSGYETAYKYLRPLWHKRFRDITIDDWQRTIDSLAVGANSKRVTRTLINQLYKFAIPRGQVSANLSSFRGEFIKIKGSGTSSPKTGFSEEEMQILWDHADTVPMAGTILLMCYTGFRIGEFLNLEFRDGCLCGGSKTKAGRDRVVPVSPKVLRFVETRPAMPEKRFREEFYKTLEQIGIDNKGHRLTPHSTRHTFATLLKRAHGSDKDKMRLIGHSSDEMLRYYQDVSIEDLRQIIAEL